ncbi:MAG: ImmA/IrrE family metallo-endopeptidase [Lachnoclostridium sp.]|jgi:hypothetical protein|nr:ImmA/IrrE family metallo-endopeptidase [Lachnoclostridium sp.]
MPDKSPREKIHEALKEIKEHDGHCHLAREICSVEHCMSQQIKHCIKRDKKYKIIRIETNWLKKAQAWSYLFPFGMELRYAEGGTGMDKRFAIAHEVGHLLLHYDPDKHDEENKKVSTFAIRDPQRETEASYFAKILLNQREDLVKRFHGGLEEKTIKEYCKEYDEDLLDT